MSYCIVQHGGCDTVAGNKHHQPAANNGSLVSPAGPAHQTQCIDWLYCARPAALGYFIGAIAPNMDVANAALPAYVTVLLFFVGLLLRNQDQPVYWRWFSYLDFLKYAWGAQMINQFEGSKAIALDFQTVKP